MAIPRYLVIVPGVLLCMASYDAGSAGCDDRVSHAEISACLGAELRAADQAINDTYSSLMKSLDEEGRSKLRTEQRAWMKERDRVCNLSSRTQDREQWYKDILQDYYKTVCVTRLTDARKLEIRVFGIESKFPWPQSNESLSRGQGRPLYDIHGSPARRQGKWYFEAKFKIADMAQSVDAAIFVGVLNTSGGNSGTLIKVRPDVQGLGISLYPADIVIGIAVDLDNGKLYIRENGEWREGVPGSSGGLDLKLGRDYHPVISSSVRLNSFLEQKLLEINFGESGFSYSLPDGYSPYRTTSAGS